ncbi:trichohyalin isoform X2 [Mastacembelus armatus]|uniref:trichohyalin isoform X2 n=1 Tax=Mastacembelus armatus TaxID=205130 RepID=UPI000E4571E5|nr:trichohyalin-like isoform X2 [Mastacembelus armatus]
MADRTHEGVERDAEDTDELLYPAPSDDNNVFVLGHPSFRSDHCDLLLDAIDAQLGQLQVQSQKYPRLSRKCDCSDAAPLRLSQSLSKDTGLGSTTLTTDSPMSFLDLIHTPTVEKTSERTTGCQESPVTHKGNKKRLHRGRRDKEEIESQREQVIWRLERLLGDTCKEDGITGETCTPSDSICTEDFVRRFREEMVEMALPDGNIQQLDKEEAEETEISDSDTCHSEQKGLSVVNVKRIGLPTTGKSIKDKETACYLQSNKPGQRKRTEDCQKDISPSSYVNSCEVHVSHVSEKTGAGEGYKSSQSMHDNSFSHKTDVVTELENLQHNCSSPLTRCLAGVPVMNFDSVSIDSDLDTVCTEQVRQHIHKQLGNRLQKLIATGIQNYCMYVELFITGVLSTGWHALVQSVTSIDEYCANLSDSDTPTQEESEPRNRDSSACKARRYKKKSYRLLCSLDDNDKDTDEEDWNRRCRPERTSEKLNQAKMKERLSNLQKKCEKEAEKLRLKKTQLKSVEFSLSELWQRKKHTLQDLERLIAETAQMEKEKGILESFLSDSRAERDSLSCQVEKLQRQRESCLLEVRTMEEELATLSQCKQTLKDGSCLEKNSVIMSVLEREEMERQLDNAKKELFAEQRYAREKLESMQEKLEETHEELQRAAEAENTLRNKCACLEEKQVQKKEQIEALEVQVSKLQAELGECKMRVGSLEKMLAQKELQLTDIQDHHRILQAEGDGLKGELQHLKIQHYKELKEAQEQAQLNMVNQQAEEEKVNALKEQTLSLTRHIEFMQSSIQIKEEEAKQLRTSLEQQREEAKNRQEELQAEALKKVQKAIEDERSKWEAEKAEAVQVHCGILEEQNQKSLENMRNEMQREKSKALAIQRKVMELKTRVQELESERCAQQRKQESLLAAICKALKEEHQAELQRLLGEMEQESQRTMKRLEQAVHMSEKEANRLQLMLKERESSHKQIVAELEQQLRHWAEELGAQCQHLHLLVDQSGVEQSSIQPPASPTVAEAFTNLRALREQLKQLINHLHQELDLQKQTIEQLRQDKERELSIQRQQLRMERNQALNFLKERLIQEHIEELSCLNWARMSDGGVAESLLKQLKAKDVELRQVQRNMGQWKEQTAARLAYKFEEQLTAELERKTSNIQGERQRQSGRHGGEITHSAKETQHPVCSPSLHAVDSAASYSSSEVSSLKLLRYLQSKVEQLRVENQAYIWNASAPDKISLDLPGSCLKTIAGGQDSAGIQSQSSIRTVSS